MPLNFWVLLVGFFRRNHGHAWPFRCRVEPSMKLWCRKGAPQLGQSLQMKAAQVIHMSTVLEKTYCIEKMHQKWKCRILWKLNITTPILIDTSVSTGRIRKKNKLASGEQPVPKLKQEKPACASRWLKQEGNIDDQQPKWRQWQCLFSNHLPLISSFLFARRAVRWGVGYLPTRCQLWRFYEKIGEEKTK